MNPISDYPVWGSAKIDFYGNVPLRAFQSLMFGEYAKMVFY